MRINEALCMEMNFGNEHVVAVVGFMLALLFCKQMLECLRQDVAAIPPFLVALLGLLLPTDAPAIP